MPHVQRHFCHLLAIDTSLGAGPKPFTRNLLGKARRKALPLPPCAWRATRDAAPASVSAHRSSELSYSPGTAWSGTSVCGVIGPKPWGEQMRWLEWSHWPECISLLHLCRAPGHTPEEVLGTPQLPAEPRFLPRGHGDGEEGNFPTGSQDPARMLAWMKELWCETDLKYK